MTTIDITLLPVELIDLVEVHTYHPVEYGSDLTLDLELSMFQIGILVNQCFETFLPGVKRRVGDTEAAMAMDTVEDLIRLFEEIVEAEQNKQPKKNFRFNFSGQPAP